MQSLQAYQKTSNLELGRTEVVHWSRSSNHERTLIASLSLVLVVELETGEAAEAEPTLATLKAVTEVVERVIVKVDEAVVEDVVHQEVLVARAVEEDAAVDSRTTLLHQHQAMRLQLLVATLDWFHSIVRHEIPLLSTKSPLSSTSS